MNDAIEVLAENMRKAYVHHDVPFEGLARLAFYEAMKYHRKESVMAVIAALPHDTNTRRLVLKAIGG